MGVAVGVATYEATATVFEYLELEPASVKGKAEPVRVFQALAPQGAARNRSDTQAHHAVCRS